MHFKQNNIFPQLSNLLQKLAIMSCVGELYGKPQPWLMIHTCSVYIFAPRYSGALQTLKMYVTARPVEGTSRVVKSVSRPDLSCTSFCWGSLAVKFTGRRWLKFDACCWATNEGTRLLTAGRFTCRQTQRSDFTLPISLRNGLAERSRRFQLI